MEGRSDTTRISVRVLTLSVASASPSAFCSCAQRVSALMDYRYELVEYVRTLFVGCFCRPIFCDTTASVLAVFCRSRCRINLSNCCRYCSVKIVTLTVYMARSAFRTKSNFVLSTSMAIPPTTSSVILANFVLMLSIRCIAQEQSTPSGRIFSSMSLSCWYLAL